MTNTKDRHSEHNDHALEGPIRQRVMKLLDKNPLLSPKYICQITQLPYKQYRRYITNIKSEWKRHTEKGQGLKRLQFHNTRFFGFVLIGLDRRVSGDGIGGLAVGRGWVRTRARNRMLLWKDKDGRLEWFMTGRVNGWVRKPANKGKVLQILANAFFRTSLIEEIGVFQKWADSFRLKGAHLVYDTGQRMPYARVELLKDSNGVIVTSGDKSNPTSLEIEFCYPDWAERNELLFTQFLDLMREATKARPLDPSNRSVV